MKTKAKEIAMVEEQEMRSRKRERRETTATAATMVAKKDGVIKAVAADKKRGKTGEKGGGGVEGSGGGQGANKNKRLKTEETVEEEEEATLEAMAKDGAWYAVNLSFDGNYLHIHYQGYSAQDDEKWHVNRFKSVQGVFSQIRFLSDVMQDRDCKQLSEGTKICTACRRPNTDKFQYYDAIVNQVVRSKHTVNAQGDEECHCSFVVVWQKGPLEGKTSKVKCGDICFLRSGSIEEDSTTRAFLQAVKLNCMKRGLSQDNGEHKPLSEVLRQTKHRKLNASARERKVNAKEEVVQCVEEVQPILPVHIPSVKNTNDDDVEGAHRKNKLQMPSTGILDESSQSRLEAAKDEINKNKAIQCVEKMQLKLPVHIPPVKSKKQYDGERKNKLQSSSTGILNESSQSGLEEGKDELNKNKSVQCVVEMQSKLPDHKYDCEGMHRKKKLQASSTGIVDKSSQSRLEEAKDELSKNKAIQCLKEIYSKLPDHIPAVKNKEDDGEGVHPKIQLQASSTGILDESSQSRLEEAKDELNQSKTVQCLVEMQSKLPHLIPSVKNEEEEDGEGVDRKKKLQASSAGILDESSQSRLEEDKDELNKSKAIQCAEEMQSKLSDHIPSVKHQKEYDGEGVHQTNTVQASTGILDEFSPSRLEEAKDELNKSKVIQCAEEMQSKLSDHIPSVKHQKEYDGEGVHRTNTVQDSTGILDEFSQSRLEEAKDELNKNKSIQYVEEIQSKLPDHIPSVKNKKEDGGEGVHRKNKLQSSSTRIQDESSQSGLEEAKDELNKNKASQCVEEKQSKLPCCIPSVKSKEDGGEGVHEKNKVQAASTGILDESLHSRLEEVKDELNKNKAIECVEEIQSKLPDHIPSVKNKKEYEGEGAHRKNKLQSSSTRILDESSQSRLEEAKDELNRNKSSVQFLKEMQSKLPDNIPSVKNKKENDGEGQHWKNQLQASSIGVLVESPKSRLEEAKDGLTKNKLIQCVEEIQSKLTDHVPSIKNKKDVNGEGGHQKAQLKSSSTGIPDESSQRRLEEAQDELNKEDEKANDGIIEGTEDKCSVSSCIKMPMGDEEVQPDINCLKSTSVKSGMKENPSNPSGGCEGREEISQVDDGNLGKVVGNSNSGLPLTVANVKGNIHLHDGKSDEVIDLIGENETSGKTLTVQNIEMSTGVSTVSSAPVESRHNRNITVKANSVGSLRYMGQKEFSSSSPIGASKVVLGMEMRTLPDEQQQTRKVVEQGGTDQTMKLHQARMVSLSQESSSVWGFKESQVVEIIDLEEFESQVVERAMDQMQVKVMGESDSTSRSYKVRQSAFDSGIQRDNANERQGRFRSKQSLMKSCVVSDTPTAVSIAGQPPVKALTCSEGILSGVMGDDRIHYALNSASNFAVCNGKEGRINAMAEREPVYSQIMGQCSSSSPSEGRVSRVSLIEDVTCPNNEMTVHSHGKCMQNSGYPCLRSDVNLDGHGDYELKDAHCTHITCAHACTFNECTLFHLQSSNKRCPCVQMNCKRPNLLPQCCGNSRLPSNQYLSSSQVLLIENMEKDVTQAEAIKVLMGISSGLSSVFVLPCLEYESWGKGYAIYVDTSSAEKAYSILNGGSLFIVSSEGRPWAVSRSQEQLFDMHLTFGCTSTSPKDQMSVTIGRRNRSLHVAPKGSIGFEQAKAKAKRFIDHKNELQLCHERYKIDEKKAQGIFVL